MVYPVDPSTSSVRENLLACAFLLVYQVSTFAMAVLFDLLVLGLELEPSGHFEAE